MAKNTTPRAEKIIWKERGMPAYDYKMKPGETMLGGWAGVLFLGRGSKGSPAAPTPKSSDSLATDSRAAPPRSLTPQQIEEGMRSLEQRVGYTMDKDDPMRHAAASVELWAQEMSAKWAKEASRSTESQEKAPPAQSATTSPNSQGST